MKMFRTLASLAIAAALAVPAIAQQKPKPGASGPVMYKCVDSRGKIYYADRVTPECGQTEELNRQGRVVKKHEAGKPAPVSKKSAADEAGKTEDSAEMRRRDHALTATYTSEDEIDMARDRSLAIPLQEVKTVENRLAKTNMQLFDLKTQADRLAGQQKAIPPLLLEEIDVKLKAVSALEVQLQKKMKYAESVRARYEADKLRYRELTTAGK